MVVMVTGLPGAGKSFFAARLAERLEGEHISSDRIRKKMFMYRTYGSQEKQAVYEEMLHRLQIAALIRNVIVDATFHKEKMRKMFLEALPKNVPVFVIEVVAEQNLIHKRLQKPRQDSEADFSVYELIRNEWEPVQSPHLTVMSTDSNIEDMLNKAERYIHHVQN